MMFHEKQNELGCAIFSGKDEKVQEAPSNLMASLVDRCLFLRVNHLPQDISPTAARPSSSH